MDYSIIISPPAEVELHQIQEYYDNLVFGLGKQFILKFEETLKFLETHPYLYSIIKDEIRKAVMNDYPYSIFYSVDNQKEEVEILAIIHNRRDPKYWKKRIKLNKKG